jgi:hypothetical protein
MTASALVLLAAAVLLVLLAWAGWTLTRLRRLDGRVTTARTALETQLRRRAGLAEELARRYPAGLGEERAARLAAVVAEVRNPAGGDREIAENALGRELRELPADLPGVPVSLQTDLAGTSTRVALARRFYNDAVRDTQALRQRRLTRWLRVHASRPVPRFFDIDDRLAGTLVGADRRPGG